MNNSLVIWIIIFTILGIITILFCNYNGKRKENYIASSIVSGDYFDPMMGYYDFVPYRRHFYRYPYRRYLRPYHTYHYPMRWYKHYGRHYYSI